MNDTDSFRLILDSYLDKKNGFVFGTNVAGAEYDGQVTNEGTSSFGSGYGAFNLNWDTSWEVATRVHDKGWSLEMAIPFRSLRFSSDEVQNWGINFQRNIRRNNETAYWAPLSRQHNLYRVSEAGLLKGVEVPALKNLRMTPYLLGKRSTGGAINSITDYEAGFDLKYSLTQALTLDVTYNTDFAQVEADALQVNLDRFSLFLPEQRPFFLENAGLFRVGVPSTTELFFSRRIGIGPGGVAIPIEAGARLSGKVNAATSVGLLHMRADAVAGVAPRNDFTVARVNHELSGRSTLGAIFVNRQGDGSILGSKSQDYNRTYGIDGRWGISNDLTLSGFVAMTDTPGWNGRDHALRVRLDYNSEEWTSRAQYHEVGDAFNPEVGFLRRRDYRHLELFTMRRIRPDNLFGLHEIRPHIAVRTHHNFDGYYESGYAHIDTHWEWKSGMEVHTGVNLVHEGVQVPFDIVPGKTVQVGDYRDEELALVFWTNQGAPLSFSITSKIGGFFGGDRVQAIPTVRYRIGEVFNAKLSWQHNNIDLPGPGGEFDIDLASLSMAYNFSPKTSLQLLLQYNRRNDLLATNLRFAWLTTADAGLYLVYNEVDDGRIPGKPRREIILKYSHMFDLLR